MELNIDYQFSFQKLKEPVMPKSDYVIVVSSNNQLHGNVHRSYLSLQKHYDTENYFQRERNEVR